MAGDEDVAAILGTRAMPASGARRFRSTSTASAFSGGRRAPAPLTHVRPGDEHQAIRRRGNAVSVLPLPVGARISVDSPQEIAGQPSACGRVSAEGCREPVAHRGMKWVKRL
jgi:hypothetical protein